LSLGKSRPHLVGLIGRALITAFRTLVRKASIGGVVEVHVDAVVDMFDHIVERSRYRLGAHRTAKIAFIAFGVVGAEFLQAVVAEAGAAHEFVAGVVKHGVRSLGHSPGT
jgi:hypothetical protein